VSSPDKNAIGVIFFVLVFLLMLPVTTLAESAKKAAAKISINANFPGGNVLVKNIEGDTVHVAPDLRGGRPWFYWYFEVEVARPCRLTFVFAGPPKLSARGPAISLDEGHTWQWLGVDHVTFGSPRRRNGRKTPVDTFYYDFTRKDQKVRFAVTIPYVQRDLDAFLKKNAANPHLVQSVLTKTRAGRPVELLQIGKPGPGVKAALVTCRHHACESVASFVLEGFLQEAMAESPVGRTFRKKYVLYAVPMVDKDGVQAGDQGKNRRPHDHNRDYRKNSIYPEVKAIRKLADEKKVELVLDFHDPLIRGESHTVFVFYGVKIPPIYENTKELSRWMKEECPPAIPNTHVWFKTPKPLDPMVGVPCATYFAHMKRVFMSATLETPYTTPAFDFDAAMARAYGAGLLRAWARMDFITAASGSARGEGDFAKLDAFRKSFRRLYRGKPRNAEALANKYLMNPKAPPLYRVEANNLMGMMRLWRKEYAKASARCRAVLDDKAATANQRVTALARQVIIACNRPGAAVADVEKARAKFEEYPYPSPRQIYNVCGHLSRFYQKEREYAEALEYSLKRLAAASKYDRGRALIEVAAIHDKLGRKEKAIATRKEAVAYLRMQLDPVPVGYMGPSMAFDLLEALNGIPTATMEEKKAAAAIALNHKICPRWLKKKIKDALRDAER